MPKTLKMIPKKLKKKSTQGTAATHIEKKPLSPEERNKKLRKDMFRIARRYEEMKLYDDAIKYYTRLGRHDDAERLAKIKNEIYLNKAKEFEAQGKYDDAIRLYENLKMKGEVERLNRKLGRDNVVQKKVETPSPGIPQIAKEKTDDLGSDQLELEDISWEGETEEEPVEDKVPEPAAPQEQILQKTPTAESTQKMFRICPYCGERLDLPKKPKFCPYCEEPFI